MKLLLVVLGLAVITATRAEWQVKKPSDFEDMNKQCTTESGITPEQLEKIKVMEFPDEEPIRKYVQCAVTKLELFCEMEGYHGDRVAAQFDVGLEPDEITEIMGKCLDKNEAKSSADVWAYRVQQCLLNTKLGERLKIIVKQETQKHAGKAEQ